MFARVNSFGVQGLSGFAVTAEADISGGLPQFSIVGLPDSAVKEAADRVRSAAKNLGFAWPASRITVNLAPARLRKTGPVYDLPVLLALLCASGQLPSLDERFAFVGELSLNGALRPVTGMLPMALAAAKAGVTHLFVPAGNAAEAAAVEGLTVLGAADAAQVAAHLRGEAQLAPAPRRPFVPAGGPAVPDFADVRGQLAAQHSQTRGIGAVFAADYDNQIRRPGHLHGFALALFGRETNGVGNLAHGRFLLNDFRRRFKNAFFLGGLRHDVYFVKRGEFFRFFRPGYDHAFALRTA